MSEWEENIPTSSKEDNGSWAKFRKFFVKDYTQFIDDREDKEKEVARIVVIGKSRVGKGSFIKAIGDSQKPKKDESDPDEFEIQGPPANVTHGIIPGPLPIKKYGYSDNKNRIIYFYDAGGFGDAYNENYDLEDALKKYQKENKIKFDAIIFMIDSNYLGKIDIEPLKVQENKVCFVLYIAKQIDVLEFKTDNAEKFQEEKGKIKGNILEVLKKKQGQ